MYIYTRHMYVLVRVLLITKATLIKDSFNWGWLIFFRSSVPYHHGGKHDFVQADVVLEEQRRVLHLDLKGAIGDSLPPWAKLKHRT